VAKIALKIYLPKILPRFPKLSIFEKLFLPVIWLEIILKTPSQIIRQFRKRFSVFEHCPGEIEIKF
jgi:hypothetical protein